MYALAFPMFSRKRSFSWFDSNFFSGNSAGNDTGLYSLGCSSSATMRATSSVAPSYTSAGESPGPMIPLTIIVSVCATRSNTSSWSAIMIQIVGVPSSSSGGRGTTGSMS